MQKKGAQMGTRYWSRMRDKHWGEGGEGGGGGGGGEKGTYRFA